MTAKVSAALVKALADLTIVETDRTANAGSYSYKYADIADVVKLTRPVLVANGLVALTPIQGYDHDNLACTVLIIHESGEELRLGPFPFPRGKDAQATGSAVTYHRRYALIAALGMATGEDDDGAAASIRTPAVVWNANTVKQALLSLCEGDKARAAEAWELGGGADLSSFAADSAQKVYDRWFHLPVPEPGETR